MLHRGAPGAGKTSPLAQASNRCTGGVVDCSRRKIVAVATFADGLAMMLSHDEGLDGLNLTAPDGDLAIFNNIRRIFTDLIINSDLLIQRLHEIDFFQ